jgi:group I intron endonuclease
MKYSEEQIRGILKFAEEQHLEGNSGIYAIIYREKWYIGSAKNFEERWIAHTKQIKSNRHHSIKLKRAILKYGISDIKFVKLEIVINEANLLVREQYWLDLTNAYKIGYNCTPTAGSQFGVTHSQETKNKISKSSKTRGISKETRQKMIESRIRNKKIISEETRQKQRKSHLGKTLSEEQKKKIGDALRGRVLSEEMKEKLSNVKKGKRFSKEHKEALSLAKKGKRSARASITDEIAKKIKDTIKTRGNKTLKEIATEFSISIDTVKRISCGRFWKDIK